MKHRLQYMGFSSEKICVDCGKTESEILREENKELKEIAKHACEVSCINCEFEYGDGCSPENCVIYRLRRLVD